MGGVMKMNRFLKQVLAAVLAVQTGLTAVPAAVYAEETEPETEVPAEYFEEADEETIPETEEVTEEEEQTEEEPAVPEETEEPEIPEETEEPEIPEVQEKKQLSLYPADELVLEDGQFVFTVTADAGFDLPLTLVFNEETYTAEVNENGDYVFALPLEGLGEGTYPLTVSFAGNEEYESCEMTLQIAVENKTEEAEEAGQEVKISGYLVSFITYEVPEEVPSEEEEEPAEFDETEISVGYQLDITPVTYDETVKINSVQYDSYLDEYKVTYKTDTDFKTMYLVAIRDGKTWFLDRYDIPGTGTFTRNVKFEIPAGEYELRVGFFAFGKLKASEGYFTLHVFDAPKVTGSAPFTGAEYAYIDIDISEIKQYASLGLNDNDVLLKITDDDPGLNLAKVKAYAEGSTFRVRLGDSSAYGNAGTYKNYPYGSFDLFYKIRSNGVSGTHVFSGSTTTHVDIMQKVVPTELNASFMSDAGFPTLFYKGATGNIRYDFGSTYDNPNDPEHYNEGLDRRVTFKSADPKKLTVDANGKVTAVKMPKTDEIVDVTVTSVANPALKKVVQVRLESLKAGEASLKALSDGKELTKFNYTVRKQLDTDHLFEVVFRIKDTHAYLNGMPVTFTADKQGLNFLTDPSDPDVASTLVVPLKEDGTASVTVRGWEAGSFTVLATTPIGKKGSMTVNVDGLTNQLAGAASKSSKYYINGKVVTGWYRYDKIEDKYVYGKDVFKNIIPTQQWIQYSDPKTGLMTTGDPWNGRPSTVKKIDGKLYAFHAGNGLILHEEGLTTGEGWIEIEHESFDGSYQAYVSKTGEIQTGWVNTNPGGWLYLDKEYGMPAYNTFVPARSGKGFTYVDNYGEITSGIFVLTKKTQTITEQDGLYRIFANGDDEFYWVKNGAFQTGWVYLHYSEKTGFVWNTTAKGALEKMYFDPDRYGAQRTGTFTVDGKTYKTNLSKYPDFYYDNIDHYETVQTLFGMYTNYPEKYGRYDGVIIDEGGAIVYNKLVKIAVWNGAEWDSYYVYTDDDGKPVTDTWQTVNGKKYYFDSNGWMSMADMWPSSWVYCDANGNEQTVYYKLKNAKKPTEGYNYYTPDGKKLTSIMLYDSGFINKVGMIDSKGSLIIDSAATVRICLESGAPSYTYVAGANGNIFRSDSSSTFLIVEAKGKSYIVDDYGEVQKNSSLPVYAEGPDGSGYVMADKNGVLYKKTFRTLTDASHGSYKVYLNEYGFAVDDGAEIYESDIKYYSYALNGKAYLVFNAPNYTGFVIPGKTVKPGTTDVYSAGWQGQSDSPVYLNKDGTIKTGFVKHGSMTKYIVVTPYGDVWCAVSYPEYFDSTNYTILYNIGEKTYFFDELGTMVTGWVHFEHCLTIDLNDYMYDNFANTRNFDDVYMYFSPKTGVAFTGKSKVPVPQLFDGRISLGDEGDYFTNGEKRVNTTGKVGTVYFTSDGMLIHDTEATVEKKLMMFNADGTFEAKAHWEDANKNRYILKSGALATGRQKVDGSYYFFDPATGYKVVNQLRKSGSKWYYYNEFGKQETPVMGRYRTVSLPEYMQDEWGLTADVMFESTNGKTLTAVWNKDGSLAKIVYANSGKAAVGECVSFGLWSGYDDTLCRKYLMAGLNGYVLDAKGLPKTGVISGFTYEIDTSHEKYSLNAGTNGKRVVGSSGFSLVKVGKKYYVMHEGLIYNRNEGAYLIDDWSSLPAADQKTLDTLAKNAGDMGAGLYVMVNPDGSVAVNTTRYTYVDFGTYTFYGYSASGKMTSNRLGVILDLCSVYYRVGKNVYMSGALGGESGTWSYEEQLYKWNGSDDFESYYATFKLDGNRLLGIYDAYTGKAVTGTCILPYGENGMIVWLKNGQTQTGNKTFTYYGYKMKFYVDPNMIGAVLEYFF